MPRTLVVAWRSAEIRQVIGDQGQTFIFGVYLYAAESGIHLTGRVLNSRVDPLNRIELGVMPEAIPKEKGR